MSKKEAKNSGYIFLHRSIREHWVWKDPRKLLWWLDILMECNHSENRVNIGFELIVCKRGQSLNSLETWSKRWRVDVSTVRRFLSLLESDKMIERENVQKTTRITVCNYDSYNSPQQAKQSQNNSKAISKQFRSNTNNNDSNNEVKNEEETTPPATKSFKHLTQEEFLISLKPFVEKYGRPMILAFSTYWREPDENGKMKFQLQKTWSTAGRLATWKRRDDEKRGFVPGAVEMFGGSGESPQEAAGRKLLEAHS